MQNETVGIICAMPMEMARLLEEMEGKEKRRFSGIDFHVGKLCGKSVVLAVCGIGKVFAAVCAEAMILNFKPALIINSGVAGSLSPALRVFDVAVGENFVQHDMDTSPLGDPVGMISGINRIELPCDSAASAALCAAAGEAETGTIASGDQFVAAKEKKEAIAASFGAIACEMEGASIAQVAFINEVPFAALRVISDSLNGDGGVEYSVFAPKAAERSAQIILKFLEEKK